MDIGQPLLRCLNSDIHVVACPSGTRSGYGVFRQGIGQLLLPCLNSGIHAVACPGEKLADIRVSHPCGAFLRPTAASEGPRVEQRAILARTF